jgi:SWIM zinc finger
MVTRSNILYSAAAFARMTQRIYRKLSAIKIQEWAHCIWVWMPGYCRFWSKAAFKQHFVEWRRAQARSLRILNTGINHIFSVPSSNPMRPHYRVEVQDSRVNCTCEDYQNQTQFFSRGCCKHGYAVLGHLGYNYLSDWIAAHQV